ncbi:MAG: DUF2851 family protein [Thermonemataceae bacterium]|nr:DUF2851 family protein [Thermonemataceae bacterium]
MQEQFLHFLWQYQYFEQQNLQTTQAESLEILEIGKHNSNEGADFEQTLLRIGNMEWQGDIEIHWKSSDWNKHKHHQNPRYNRVILHIVWENDVEDVFREDGTPLPTLELKKRVNPDLLEKYKYLQDSSYKIPCRKVVSHIEHLYWFLMLDKALAHRLEQKAQKVEQIWLACQKNWEETTYRLLAQAFGFKINADAFLRLAEQLPLKILLKHSTDLLQMEALIFGQAGFLEDDTEVEDEYFVRLQKEYRFLKAKYELHSLKSSEWNFAKLRPANFPTLRLAQFAQIIHQHINLFSVFLYAEQYKTLEKILLVEPSDYWKTHVVFGKTSKGVFYKLGKVSFENIVINMLVPLLVLYAQKNNKQDAMDKALRFLQAIKAEENYITREWQELGIKAQHAADSQALIEQYNYFCMEKKCLSCVIGAEILKNKK